MESILISYYIGIFIVFASHIYILVTADKAMSAHSVINLFAAMLIAYYFMSREKII